MSIPEIWYPDFSGNLPKQTTWLHMTAGFGLLRLSMMWFSHLG
jgi:hypothetical protein